MTKKDKENIESKIMNEGFDYCFVHYTSFPEILDTKFHDLRKAFLESREQFVNYLKGEGIEETY